MSVYAFAFRHNSSLDDPSMAPGIVRPLAPQQVLVAVAHWEALKSSNGAKCVLQRACKAAKLTSEVCLLPLQRPQFEFESALQQFGTQSIEVLSRRLTLSRRSRARLQEALRPLRRRRSCGESLVRCTFDGFLHNLSSPFERARCDAHARAWLQRSIVVPAVMAQVLASAAACETFEHQPSKQTGSQSPVHLSATRADSSEPRTPDNEPPAFLSRQGVDSPTSAQHAQPSAIADGAAGDAFVGQEVVQGLCGQMRVHTSTS